MYVCVVSHSPEAILDLVKGNNQIECPVGGCNRYVNRKDLQLDKRMTSQLAKYKQNQSNQDDENVYSMDE